MNTETHFREILNNIEYEDWTFLLETDPLALRIQATTEDNVKGGIYTWKGRKWILSKHMTDGEVVQTAWLAVQTASMHELRERFKYKGQAIFDPHYDIDKLVKLRQEPDSLKERD